MNEYIVAIEFGSTKIVGIAGYRDEKGLLVVSAIDEISTTGIVKRGCVQNVEEAFSCVKKLIRMLENRLAPAKIVKVYVKNAGRILMIKLVNVMILFLILDLQILWIYLMVQINKICG